MVRSGLSEGQKEYICHSRKKGFQKKSRKKILAPREFVFFNKKIDAFKCIVNLTLTFGSPAHASKDIRIQGCTCLFFFAPLALNRN